MFATPQPLHSSSVPLSEPYPQISKVQVDEGSKSVVKETSNVLPSSFETSKNVDSVNMSISSGSDTEIGEKSED